MDWKRFVAGIPIRWLVATLLVGVAEGLLVKLVWWPAMAILATILTYPRGGPSIGKLDYHEVSSQAGLLAMGMIVAFLVLIGRAWRHRIHGPFWIGAITVAVAQFCVPLVRVVENWAAYQSADPLQVLAFSALTLVYPGLASIPLGGGVSWLVLRWLRRPRPEASPSHEPAASWWRGFLQTPVYWVSASSNVAMANGIMIKLVWWASLSALGTRSPFGLSSLAAVITIALSWSIMMFVGRRWRYRVPTPFWFGAIVVTVAEFLTPLIWDFSAGLAPPDSDLTRRDGPLMAAAFGLLSWAYPGALTIPLAGTISYLLLRKLRPLP